MTDTASRTLDWWQVHLHALPILAQVETWPTVGTLAWIELDADHPAKRAAVYDGIRKYVLHLEGRQEAMAQASHDVSAAVDCTAIAKGVRRRASGIYIAREVA